MATEKKTVVAFGWASGLIEIGPRKRPGACVICRGEEEAVTSLMNAAARHGRGQSEGKLLVPGVPEASDRRKAMDAFIAFVGWLEERGADGITSWGK